MNGFTARLSQPRPLLLDGATGTELTRRGIETPLPLWSAAALRSDPESVGAIHLDYLRAGADIITTNTFRTHARNVGNTEEARRLTILAVELAKQARSDINRPAWIAGSVAPLEDCYSPQLTPDRATCQKEHHTMVEYLAGSGVDFVLIETMNTIHEAEAAAHAARIHELPFIVSFVLNKDYNLLSGETLEQAVSSLERLEPAAFMINCIPTRHISAALRKLSRLTNLPTGAYGNMGVPDDVVGWAFEGGLSAEAYCEHAAEWLEIGAKFIGSCCGSNPSHTAALHTMMMLR